MQVHRLPDGSLTASFVYNAEGLRVQKTVNGVVTKYILHGKNITHLIRDNDELHFFYDASGSPAMVEWNNGTTTATITYDAIGNRVPRRTQKRGTHKLAFFAATE